MSSYRFGRMLGVLCVLALGAGCVKQKTVLVVNPDGSGHITVSRVFTKQAVAMIEH